MLFIETVQDYILKRFMLQAPLLPKCETTFGSFFLSKFIETNADTPQNPHLQRGGNTIERGVFFNEVLAFMIFCSRTGYFNKHKGN